MRFASYSASDLDTADALDDLLSQAERFDDPVHLAAVFFGPAHLGRAAEIASAIQARLEPRTLFGTSAEFVLGGGREVEEVGGISLLVGHLPGARVVPVRLDIEDFAAKDFDADHALDKLGAVSGKTRGLLGIAEPFSFRVGALVDLVNTRLPGVPIIGGIASAARAPGNNRLILDDQVYDGGYVGVTLGGDVRMDAVVSQGCRPIWSPMLVTRASGNAIAQLGGRPALKVLRELIEGMGDGKQVLGNGLMIGKVVSEYREQFGVGDFLIRGILGVNEQHEAIGIGDRIRVGTTVQFHIRDAQTARDDLIAHLDLAHRDGPAAGGLLFNCNGRGTRLFEEPNHDVDAIEDRMPGTPVAGLFAAGEIGPVGKTNYIHGHTACMALFRPGK